MFSIKPRERASEKGAMFKLVKSRFSEVHCETLFQKLWVDLQCQKIFPVHLYIWKNIFSKPLSLAFHWWESLSFDQNLTLRGSYKWNGIQKGKILEKSTTKMWEGFVRWKCLNRQILSTEIISLFSKTFVVSASDVDSDIPIKNLNML